MSKNTPLSNERKNNILLYLGAYQRKNNHPPTIREIAEVIGPTSTSCTNYYLSMLNKADLISRIPKISRGITLTDKGQAEEYRLRVLLGVADPHVDPKICQHNAFDANVTVNRLTDIKGFQAEVQIHCSECHTPFAFIGLPHGVNLNGATTSIAGTELCVPVAPVKKGRVKPIQGVTGFSISRAN